MKSCHITTTYLCVFNWSRHLGTWLMERKRYMVQNPHCTSHKKMLNLVDLYGNRCRRRNKWRGGRRLLLNCLILWFTAGQYRSTKTVSFKINILTLKKKINFWCSMFKFLCDLCVCRNRDWACLLQGHVFLPGDKSGEVCDSHQRKALPAVQPPAAVQSLSQRPETGLLQLWPAAHVALRLPAGCSQFPNSRSASSLCFRSKSHIKTIRKWRVL